MTDTTAPRTAAPDLARLRELASVATPGPWTDLTYGTASQEDAGQLAYRAVMARHDPDCPDCQWTDMSWVETTPDGPHIALTGNGPNASENARYIAALEPATVLALLDRAEAIEPLLALVRLTDEMSDDWTSVERAIWPNGPASGTGSGAYAGLKGRIVAALRAAQPAEIVPAARKP